MKPLQVILAITLILNFSDVTADVVRLTCIVPDFSDGNPKSLNVTFNDGDNSWILVNKIRYPDEDETGKTDITIDGSKIEWCHTLSRGRGNEPAVVCHTANRMTGSFLIVYHRTGKTRTGNCSVGRIPEGRKF